MFTETQAPSSALTIRRTDNGQSLAYVLAQAVGDMGGASKATLLLCEALVRIGSQVKLFVSAIPEPAFIEHLRTRGIEVVTPLINKGWRFGIPQKQLAYQLYFAALRESPTLIHSVSLSAESRCLLRLPHIAAPLYLWETTEALPYVNFLDKEIHKYLHKATAILAPSETIRRNIQLTYNYNGRINLLPFWVEEPACPNNSKQPHIRTANFLYVGRLDLNKGFEYLFAAFRQVRAASEDASLTVRGSGAIEEVRKLAEGILGITVEGYCNSQEYEELVERCDAVVLPSLHEGYPLALLEACARHKPIIASTVGSIPEVFGKNACALLVPPRNTVELSRAMLALLAKSDDCYRKSCANAYELFQKLSSATIVLDRLRKAYDLTTSNGPALVHNL